ncbi:LacI family DNA-binding transcriptional regulator [Kineothrix sp. MB12-C1]|uniref:LacI family DNA-binding transcriptional regulator n=1 Tax=Kineothrix sp. MB12-C1 TaxID=3070215 RepID=UPI0027D335AA|nr:LacI family DNA-binding transcriptional regulator [Kineothrix sp. MB12-C1]WMC94184.1 LacI family DNA-binding transcriptional regulator [Kineothrix sp. MB12-C1]
MAITINDVAKEAGVSTSTVSKVLNHWTSISPETTARVNEAIRKLNYTPNARAVSFARGSTLNILFLSTLAREQAYNNPHMFDILCGAQKELSVRGYTLMLSDIPPDVSHENYLETLISQKAVDGIIIHGSAYSPKMVKPLLDSQFPHILIGHPGSGSRLCWIDTNNKLAGQFAAEHLLECGYTKTAFVGSKKTDHISTQRLTGFLSGMYDYGYRIPEEYISYTDSSIEESQKAVQSLLSLPEPPCALVCENNTISLGAVRAISESRLKIPEDIALLTFDRYPYSNIISPTPTIIDIDVYDLGVQAATMLLRKIENPSLLVQSYTTLPVLKQGLTTLNK